MVTAGLLKPFGNCGVTGAELASQLTDAVRHATKSLMLPKATLKSGWPETLEDGRYLMTRTQLLRQDDCVLQVDLLCSKATASDLSNLALCLPDNDDRTLDLIDIVDQLGELIATVLRFSWPADDLKLAMLSGQIVHRLEEREQDTRLTLFLGASPVLIAAGTINALAER